MKTLPIKPTFQLLQVVVMAFLLSPITVMAQNNGEVIDADDRQRLNAVIRAQEAASDTIWKYNGSLGLNFSQSYFSNWASGGQNSISVILLGSGTAKYRKGRSSWETNLDLAYGQLSQADNAPIKTNDRIDLTSKYGYQSGDSDLFYTALLNFRSQFAPGYEIVDGVEVEPKISDFLAPAYSLASLGADYKPNENFSVFISPLTAKMTIVNIDRLATAYGVDEGENFRLEIGAFVKMAYKKEVFENVTLDTKLDLFSNYGNNPDNIDVNWETLITMKINKWLSAQLATQLIYDDDIEIVLEPEELGADGEVLSAVQTGPRTQFKEVFSLGLSVTF